MFYVFKAWDFSRRAFSDTTLLGSQVAGQVFPLASGYRVSPKDGPNVTN